MFAKGGKTKGTDIIKGIQKILGVDDNQMAELWQVGINKYGSEEGIAQALNEATKGLTPQSSPDEVKAAVATVFSTGSEMFKCGGKLQKLAKRFAKGSSIDCGCNGTKLKQNGGLLNNRFYNLPDRVYNEKGVFSGYINGPEDVTYIQSRKEPRDWTVQSPTPQARLNNTTNQSRMLWNPEKLPEPYYTAYVITENPEGKGTVAHIPMNQDGGEVTEAANGVRLTRQKGGIANSDGYKKRPSFSKRLNLDATINSKEGNFGGIAYDETYPESTIIRRIYEYPNGEADTLLIKRGMTFASPYGNAVIDSNYIEPSKVAWKKANNKFELAKDAALLQQKGGIVKGQTGINSENIDSAPEQVMRIPKYGTIRLLKSRNFAGSEQPDSTFTFAPISKSAYYIPGGTYSRFTNFDGNVETRGYDIDSPNNFTYGETAHRQFNGIRSLWEANKDKRKIVIPKNTGTY